MLTKWSHILYVTGLIGKVKTVNFGYVGDDTITQQHDITPMDGLCHSLSVNLSNTVWAPTRLKNELSKNVIL